MHISHWFVCLLPIILSRLVVFHTTHVSSFNTPQINNIIYQMSITSSTCVYNPRSEPEKILKHRFSLWKQWKKGLLNGLCNYNFVLLCITSIIKLEGFDIHFLIVGNTIKCLYQVDVRNGSTGHNAFCAKTKFRYNDNYVP